MSCPPSDTVKAFLQSIDRKVVIDLDKENPTRYDVMSTTEEHVRKMLLNLSVEELPKNSTNSVTLVDKLAGILKRVASNNHKSSEFVEKIIKDSDNIQLAIGLHEVIESVTGEVAKATNIGISHVDVSPDGVLPAIPLARVAAVIGRKVLYQQGYRINSTTENPATPEQVEQIYFSAGMTVLNKLESKGYVKFQDKAPSIKDYRTKDEENDANPEVNVVVTNVKTVSLDTKALGVTAEEGNKEHKYFTDRAQSDTSNTSFGYVIDSLTAIRQITQPSKYLLPSDTGTVNEAVLEEPDNSYIGLDLPTKRARRKLFKHSLQIHGAVGGFLQALNEEMKNQNKPISKILLKAFSASPRKLQSLFGFKRADLSSVDRVEHISGQNLSTSVPLNDIVEFLDYLTDEGGKAKKLHFPLFGGRNMRLYYVNSVLNAHASKQSRYMLTAGKQPVRVRSKDFAYLVHAVSESLNSTFTFEDITKGKNENLEKALSLFDQFNTTSDLKSKLKILSLMPESLAGVDYVRVLTSLQAVKDIREAKDGIVSTEFMVSADATASGGTLTFLQIAGSNPRVKTFLEDLGILTKEDGSVVIKHKDIYEIMTDAMTTFVKGGEYNTLISDNSEQDEKFLKDTINLLFQSGDSVRELSKPATTTFVYQQGKKSAIQTISDDLAERIVDNLEDPNVKVYLDSLMEGTKLHALSTEELMVTNGLLLKIKEAIKDRGIPSTIYALLESSLKDKYLTENKERGDKIFALVKRVMKNKVLKVLPAGAVLDHRKAKYDLADLGMPVAKVFEVMNTLDNGDRVLTRKQILHKAIMDVSTIHSIDSALLYHAIDRVNLSGGVVVVHDDIRGSAQDVRAVMEEYVKLTKEVMQVYDVHDQMLQSLEIYHPEVRDTAEFKALRADIDKTMGIKKEIAKKFNLKTDALIGDTTKVNEFAGSPETVSTRDFLKGLSPKSPLIAKFLKAFNTTLKEGDTFSFDTSSDTITINTSTGTDSQVVEAIEHEITHAATVTVIRKGLNGEGSKGSRNDVAYIGRALLDLYSKIDTLPKSVQDRLNYIKSFPDHETQLGEFVAILNAEKSVAEEFYKTVGKGSLAKVVDNFMKHVVRYIRALTDADFKAEIEPELLYGAIQRTVNTGFSERTRNYEETMAILKDIDHVYNFGAKGTASQIAFLNRAVSRLLIDKAEERGKSILGNAHTILSKYPKYTEVADKLRGIYGSSKAFQQLMHTITGEGVDKLKKAKILAEYARITAQRNDVIQLGISEFDELLKNMTEESKNALENAVTKVPLHVYFTQATKYKTVKSIDEEVLKLQDELPATANAIVEDLATLNVDEEAEGNHYNLEKLSSNSEYHEKMLKLLTLRSIQKVGTKDFLSVMENKPLATALEDHVMANHLSLLGITGRENLRANGLPHSYREGIATRVVTLDNLAEYESGKEDGWIIVEKPTKTDLGLAYRKIIDSTTLQGAFTDIKMSTADIVVTPEFKNYSNVMNTSQGYKLITTSEQRAKMGVLSGVHSLVRSTAHAMSIQESQIIRDTLLKEETTLVLNIGNMGTLIDTIADSHQDNPWFLQADGVTFADLATEVKAKYMPVGKRTSDVAGFNEKVTWVRKDISHWLMGDYRNSPFSDPKWKWGLRITKDLVSMAKIGMVILNPMKIVRDNISNISYLSVMGVDPVFAAKAYKEIMEQYGDYTEVKKQLITLKVQLAAKPDSTKLKEKEKSLRAKMKQNPISSIEDKGFLNSLGSSLIARESETLGGAQQDVDTALKFLLKDAEGKNTYLSHFLMTLQNIGPNGEDFLNYIGGIVGKAKSGKEMESELTKIGKRLAQIRNNKDAVAYASQFINSPRSEAVEFGASITDLSDVLAKETYYRFLVSQGMTPDKAKVKVLDSFPNYIENMPIGVQQLSDAGVLMFPTYWMRIQKTIYRMGKNKPLSLATEEIIDSFTDTHIESIVDSSVVEKATSWGGFLHSPFENVGFASIFPTHIF